MRFYFILAGKKVIPVDFLTMCELLFGMLVKASLSLLTHSSISSFLLGFNRISVNISSA